MSVRSEILVSCNDQLLKITEAPVLASGGLNEVRVVFTFCEKWNGFAKTATFYRDVEEVYYAVLDENDTCVVPWEVCYEDGTFFFSVFGEKGEVRRTASVVRYRVKKGAIVAEMIPSDPTPEVYDQIMSELAQIREEEERFIEEAGTAIAENNAATQDAIAATDRANVAAGNAESATTSANAAAASANTATANANTATANANAATTSANNAASEARTAASEANTARETLVQDAGEILASLSDAVFAMPIERSVMGDVIAVNDASDYQLRGLSIYGKTTQDGTPTPEAPVELVSAGNSGAINTTVCGKNLLKPNVGSQAVSGATVTIDNDGTITINGTATANGWVNIGNFQATGDLVIAPNWSDASKRNGTNITINNDGNYVYGEVGSVYFTRTNPENLTVGMIVMAGTYSNVTLRPMIRFAIVTDETYEPYKEPKTLTASTPNGLPGVPINASYGEKPNYTDEKGQGWICDEVDLTRGVYVQRVKKITTLPAATSVGTYTNGGKSASFQVNGLKDGYYPLISDRYRGGNHYLTDNNTAYGKARYILVNDNRFTDVATCDAIIAEEKPEFLCLLDQPIETPLSAEELAQYSALHTNKPNTTVYNDSGAGLKLEYIADTKLYIDNKFTELQNAILSAGANI